jgi:hypothetical protein
VNALLWESKLGWVRGSCDRQAASQAKAAAETWLRDGRPHGTMLEDHKSEVPKLLKGESITDGIERLRRRGRELRADLHRIASAPYPSAHAKAQMRQLIEARAMQGAPSTALLVEHDRRVASIISERRARSWSRRRPLTIPTRTKPIGCGRSKSAANRPTSPPTEAT